MADELILKEEDALVAAGEQPREEKPLSLDDMVPAQIVAELDKYVIGQDKAKRTIAVALRNRSRRKKLPDSIREEVYP